MVGTEQWRGLLAYNLVRHSLLQAAVIAECSPRRLSVCAGLRFLEATWLTAAPHTDDLTTLIEQRLTHSALPPWAIARIEPRAIKRRPTSHDLLAITSITECGTAIRERYIFAMVRCVR